MKKMIFGVLFLFTTTIWTAASLDAATILERSIQIRLQADGSTVETTRMRVLLENAADADAWARYPIYLDDHRELLSVTASAQHADGSKDQVRRKERDTIEASSNFYDSTYYEVLSFEGLREGSTITISYKVSVRPYYPAGQLALRSSEPIQALDISVEGHAEGHAPIRWRIDGPKEGLVVTETEHGVRVSATDLPKVDPPDYAPSGAPVATVLRYSWSEDRSWDDIGTWYQGLLDPLPRAEESVRVKARELIDGVEQPRERMEILLAFLRNKVRYVAIEVGIGGYRPTPPHETLERRFGDCKDKAMLLIDMLAEAGIEAHPALIYSGRNRKIDLEFPSPWQFNHLIVAVPEGEVAVEADDPVGDGFFFLDPTQEIGGAKWLHPGVQDQDALVVIGEETRIARTPLRPQHESRALEVDLEIEADGAGRGTAKILLHGAVATRFLDDIESAPPERMEESTRYIFQAFLPGGDLARPTWTIVEGDLPAVELVASFYIRDLVQNSGRSPSMRLESMSAFPATRHLDDRELPMIVAPDVTTARWTIRLPEGVCLPKAGESLQENSLGSFRQTVRHGDTAGVFFLERAARLDQRWVSGEALEHLRTLSTAENRALKRRIRLRCAS